jgi:hypothetical protein
MKHKEQQRGRKRWIETYKENLEMEKESKRDDKLADPLDILRLVLAA